MHPLFSRLPALVAYLAIWLVLGILAAMGLVRRGHWPWAPALGAALPLAVVYGVVCLAAWYVCRAFPLHGGGRRVVRVLLAHLGAASLTGMVWAGLGQWWLQTQFPDAAVWSRDASMVLFAVGELLFLLSSAMHYVFIAVQEQEAARRQALESAVLAREAELRALRAQVNPHFLFNSLHSIGALAGSSPTGARDMAIALGEFLRQSLRLGAQSGVPLQQEVDLVAQYLTIEQVRFGDRLSVRLDVSAQAGACMVPPLLLQPLIENAIKHGVAGLLDGGTVALTATVAGGGLRIEIVNAFDPEARPRTGTATGLRNVRDRLAAYFSGAATCEARVEGAAFIVAITCPAVTAEARAEEDQA